MFYSFVVFVTVMILAAISLFLMSIAISPKNPHPVKEDTYECGMPVPEPVISSVNFQYYFFAIIFIAMDIAGMIYVLYSTAGKSGINWLFGIFTIVLLIPLVYVMSGGKNDS